MLNPWEIVLARRLLSVERMPDESASSTPSVARKCVLLVVEDEAMAALLVEALLDAGHVAQPTTTLELVRGEIDCSLFDAAIVDLDSWDRHGAIAIARLREAAPNTTILALFPCGGLASDFAGVRYHFALEKPARIHAVLAALQASVTHPEAT